MSQQNQENLNKHLNQIIQNKDIEQEETKEETSTQVEIKQNNPEKSSACITNQQIDPSSSHPIIKVSDNSQGECEKQEISNNLESNPNQGQNKRKESEDQEAMKLQKAAKYFYPLSNKSNPFPIVKFSPEEQIFLRNPQELESKIIEMRNRQKNSAVDIITDFDQTISSFYDDQNRMVATSFGAFRGSQTVSESFKQTSKELFDYYFSYESSPDHTFEEKYEKMHEWTEKTMKLIQDHNITTDWLHSIMNDNVLAFRYGFDTFFKYSIIHQLNFLVISGGMSDVIFYSLEALGNVREYKQLHLLANKLLFDEGGNPIGVGDKIVHSHNKESVLSREEYPYLHSNCLLFGDMLTDCYMTKYAYYTNQIKIGFVKNKQDIPAFVKKFDIVCHNQGSFVTHEYLLRKILHPREGIPHELEEKMATLSKELIQVIKQADLKLE